MYGVLMYRIERVMFLGDFKREIGGEYNCVGP